MINKLKPKSEFTRNVLTLMIGTTIAQAIPIAISPILTRLYTPEDFGVLALFTSITSILGTIATGRYELAIMLPKKDEDAINIFALGFIINVAISLLTLILVIIFHKHFIHLLNNKGISVWLYFIPFAVFFIGLFNLLNYYNIRQKEFKDLAKATVFKSVVLSIVQINIGFIKQGASGLVLGQFFSQVAANSKLIKNITKNKELLSSINRAKIFSLAKKYKNFPMYSMPGALTSTFSKNFTEILISTFFGIATLGFYSLTNRVLSVPVTLIGNSISQVYFQQAADEAKKEGNAIKAFRSTAKKLLIIAIPFFLILYFVVEDIFIFIFGEQWQIAGLYAKIIIPFIFVNFIFTPLSSTYDIFDGLKIELIWKVLYFIGILIIIFLCKNRNFLSFLKIFTAYSTLMYLISIYIIYKLVKGNLNDK